MASAFVGFQRRCASCPQAPWRAIAIRGTQPQARIYRRFWLRTTAPMQLSRWKHTS